MDDITFTKTRNAANYCVDNMHLQQVTYKIENETGEKERNDKLNVNAIEFECFKT